MIGCGTMGGGISMSFANVGIPVKILEMNEEALEKGLGVIRSATTTFRSAAAE